MKKIALPALFLFLFGGLLFMDSAPPSSGDGTVQVPPGTTGGEVVRRLAADGRLRSPRWMRFLMRVTGTGRRLRAGIYPVRAGDGAWTLVRRLSAGKGITVRVTLPEGWTVARVAERLEAQGVCGADPFLALAAAENSEGFLFPDTYEFDPFISAAEVHGQLTSRFGKEWRALAGALPPDAVAFSSGSFRADRVKLGGKWWPVRDVATLASIVEREGGRAEERPRVAAVYHNRLKKRMRLEADPTVQYALGRWKERLLYKDLDVESPYNTYRVYGLPPGPIGNPGRDSLAAVLSPAPVNDLYFVADGEGGHRFSPTYAEHLRNVRAFRRTRSLEEPR